MSTGSEPYILHALGHGYCVEICTVQILDNVSSRLGCRWSRCLYVDDLNDLSIDDLSVDHLPDGWHVLGSKLSPLT